MKLSLPSSSEVELNPQDDDRAVGKRPNNRRREKKTKERMRALSLDRVLKLAKNEVNVCQEDSVVMRQQPELNQFCRTCQEKIGRGLNALTLGVNLSHTLHALSTDQMLELVDPSSISCVESTGRMCVITDKEMHELNQICLVCKGSRRTIDGEEVKARVFPKMRQFTACEGESGKYALLV